MAVIAPTCLGLVVIIITALLIPLALFTLVARLVSRRIKKRPLTWDDYLISAAYIFSIATGTCALIAILAGGMGHQARDLRFEDISLQLQVFLGSFICWILTMTAVKLSILILYVHTFPLRKFLVFAYPVMGLVVALFVATVLVTFLNCRPFAKSWMPMIPGECGDIAKENLAVVSANMALDIVVVCLPVPVVWGLQMKRGKRLAIIGIFSAGIVVCVFSALRLYATSQVVESNFPATAIWAVLWNQLEAYCAIITTCLPVAQPFFATIWKRAASWGSQASRTGTTTAPSTGRTSKRNSKKGDAQIDVERGDRIGFARLGSTCNRGGYSEAVAKGARRAPGGEEYEMQQDGIGVKKEIWVDESEMEGKTTRSLSG